MKVVRDVASTSSYGGNFTGQVDLSMLRPAAHETAPDVALVHFHDGAATHWHSHPGGQLLWVVSGNGRVGTEADGEVTLPPGTLVETPAGELHYHGAAATTDAQLLAITWGTTDWTDTPAPHQEES